MPSARKKGKSSPEYLGDNITPIGEIPARHAVTLSILPDQRVLNITSKKAGDAQIPYLKIVSLEIDNEPHILAGSSPIPAEALAEVPENKGDELFPNEFKLHNSIRWYLDLQYLDENGDPQRIFMIEMDWRGWYSGMVKSRQTEKMEEFARKNLSAQE